MAHILKSTRLFAMNFPMNFKLTFFGSLLIGLMVTSCARQVPYDKNLRANANLSYVDLENIYFFLSHEVQLERKETEQGAQVQTGRITAESATATERVIFPKETKGLLVGYSSNGDTLSVSFEKDDNHYLTFVRKPNVVNPRDTKQGRFYLHAINSFNRGTGKVIYHGDEFMAKVIPNDMRDYNCTISVKMREFRRSRVNTRSVSGRSLD